MSAPAKYGSVLGAMMLAAGIAALAVTSLSVNGCITAPPVPEPIVAAQPSFDGNEANSGFLGFLSDGSGRITAHARNRYNELVEVYGRDYLPPLTPDAGITPLPDGTFAIDAQRLVAFGEMATKHRSAISPSRR